MSRPAEPELLDTAEAGPAAVRGGVLRLAGYGAGVLLSVGSAALLFRHLGVEDGGRYVAVLALLGIVSGITEIGLTTIGVRELATRPRHEQEGVMRNLLGLRLVLAVAGVAAAVAFAAAVGYEGTMVLGTAIAGVGVVALAAQSTLGVALMAGLRFGWVTALDLLRQTLMVAGIVVLVLVGAGLLPFLALSLPVGLAALLVTAWVVRSEVPLMPSFERAEWWSLLREVLPFVAATVIAAVYFRAAMITLSLVASATETGYFAAPFRITEVLLLVPGIVVGAAFPIFARAARDDHGRLAYGVDRVFQACLLLGALFLVGLVTAAPFAIDVVAGEEFAASADVLRIQAVALLFAFPNAALFYALLSLRRYRALIVVAAAALAVNVVLAAVLGSSSGAEGAATATAIAELIAVAAGILLLWRAAPAVVPRLGLVPRVALAAALGCLVLLIPGLPSVAAGVLAIAIYLAALLVLRAIPAELLDLLPRRDRASAGGPAPLESSDVEPRDR
jgi:O-antigen/teichoic acid export membrane protein